MDRADLVHTEEIAQIRRDGGKPATVEGEQDQGTHHEQRQAGVAGGCDHEVEDQANPQVDHVDVLPADDIGGRRPDKAPAHVGQ